MTNNSFHFPVVLNELCSHIAHYDLLSPPPVVKNIQSAHNVFHHFNERNTFTQVYTPSVTQSNLNYL